MMILSPAHSQVDFDFFCHLHTPQSAPAPHWFGQTEREQALPNQAVGFNINITTSSPHHGYIRHIMLNYVAGMITNIERGEIKTCLRANVKRHPKTS